MKILHNTLEDPTKILLPPLLLKLGLTKQFVQHLPKDGDVLNIMWKVSSFIIN